MHYQLQRRVQAYVHYQLQRRVKHQLCMKSAHILHNNVFKKEHVCKYQGKLCNFKVFSMR